MILPLLGKHICFVNLQTILWKKLKKNLHFNIPVTSMGATVCVRIVLLSYIVIL